jgi:hypothetical protein
MALESDSPKAIRSNLNLRKLHDYLCLMVTLIAKVKAIRSQKNPI